MTADQLKDVIEEIAAWTLEDRRAYIANLAIVNPEEANQVKDGLTAIWNARRG